MKKASTIEQQIVLLRSRGVIIEDEQKAKEVLLDIGYFRLCSYFFPFEKSYPKLHHRTHEYMPGTRFEDAVALYYFDFDLRQELMRYISRVEIAFRTYLTYSVSNRHNDLPTWFVDKSIVSQEYASNFDSEVYTPQLRLYNPVIKRHHAQYHDNFAPAWKTIEYMTFGAVLKLFENLNQLEDKQNISDHFNVHQTPIFDNYMETIRVLRNACAHGNVLFDFTTPKAIKSGPAGKMLSNDRHNLHGVITILLYIIRQISKNRAHDLNSKVDAIFAELQRKAPQIYTHIVQITGF